MISRSASDKLLKAAGMFPIVCVTGPRQSGKTTLCKAVFNDRPYVSFENPDTRERFNDDPLGFLARYNGGAVFDEAQRCPDIFSYLQGIVDGDTRMGRFILTGSQQFHLISGITQSLAGRTVTLELLPFSYDELEQDGHIFQDPPDLNTLMIKGFYPPLYDRPVTSDLWYAGYIRNYLERDVRALSNISNLDTFQRFIRLLAARTGQLINYSELGVAAGISHNTIKAWISILEASYVVFHIRPFHTNFSKRLVKTAKIYFYDPGLLCWLLSIKDAEQLDLHPMRGNIFESFVVAELMKSRFNSLSPNNLFFWRDRSGNEIDLILDHGKDQTPIEIKSGSTFQSRFLKMVSRWEEISATKKPPILIYGGDDDFTYKGTRVVSWRKVSGID